MLNAESPKTDSMLKSDVVTREKVRIHYLHKKVEPHGGNIY